MASLNIDMDKTSFEQTLDKNVSQLQEPYRDAQAERELRRKIDFYIVPTVSILYLFCFVDRTNIGNARLAGFEQDLSLRGYDYNIVLSVFYVAYIIFTFPGTLACKWLGPGWCLPALTLGFGITTIAFAFVKNIKAAIGIRFLLGVLEAGMMPGIAYYLSRWYRRSELVFRLSLYFVMSPFAGAFGGLLASGILTLDHFGSTKRWEMIFAIEGIITVGLAVVAFFTLTDRPATARWLTEEEKQLAAARVVSERVGHEVLLDELVISKLMRGVINPVVLSSAMVSLLINTTAQGYAIFLPTIVRTIYPDKPVIQQQLLTVPQYILSSIMMLTACALCWRYDRRNIFMTIGCSIVIPAYIIFLATTNPNARYAATFLIAAGSFPIGPIIQAQAAANVVSDTARSAALGTVVFGGNIGGLIATWSFLPGDSPNYRIGNGLNLAGNSAIFIGTIILGFWMRYANSQREENASSAHQKLNELNEEQINELDWKNPDFRWRP